MNEYKLLLQYDEYHTGKQVLILEHFSVLCNFHDL